jgi:hypothetical protein
MEYAFYTDIYLILYSNPKGELNKKAFADEKEMIKFYWDIY